MNQLTKPETPERSKINLDKPDELKRWSHALGVPKNQLREVVEKVGNAAATVRKKIDRLRISERKC